MPLIEKRLGWHEHRAVREDRVIVPDGNQYFNRPGQRLVESLEIPAEALHSWRAPAAVPPQRLGSLAAGAAFLLNRGWVFIPFFINRSASFLATFSPMISFPANPRARSAALPVD
jgi:hypothetical protein